MTPKPATKFWSKTTQNSIKQRNKKSICKTLAKKVRSVYRTQTTTHLLHCTTKLLWIKSVMLNFENYTTHCWNKQQFCMSEKKIKSHVTQHIHMLLYREKKKTSYLANSFRLNVTLLSYVTYVVISIQKNDTQKSVTSGNIQNTKDWLWRDPAFNYTTNLPSLR